jgi:polyisoprenoid-binding protein YceI
MSETITPTPEPSGGIPTWAKRTVFGLVAAVVLFFGAIFLYAEVLNDSPDEFTASDLDAALDVGSTATPSAPSAPSTSATTTPAADDGAYDTTTPPPASSAPAAAPTTTPATPATTAGSSWVATDASQVGYRVEEILFGVDTTAVGRTDQVDGSLAILGTEVTAVEFSVDVASIESDDSRRDNQFRGRIMSADEFPTATFALTAPIELGAEPADGVEVATTATGELTLRGATQPVTFDVIAKQDNGLIGVQGSIPVVFADYGIANPSFAGITTEDNGLVEFVLVFQPA